MNVAEQAYIKKQADEKTKQILKNQSDAVVRIQTIDPKVNFEVFKKKSLIDEFYPSNKQITSATNQPSSIQFLNQYWQKRGYSSMGSVDETYGQKYIGRVKKIIDGNIVYEKPKSQYAIIPDNPDIKSNFTYLAEKTTRDWNRFVQSQAQLGRFLGLIKTKEGQDEFMRNHINQLSIGTYIFKLVSSLWFAYKQDNVKNIFDLDPLQIKFLQDALQTLKGKKFEDCINIIMEVLSRFQPSQNLSFSINYIGLQLAGIQTLLRSFPQQSNEILTKIKMNYGAYIPKQAIKKDSMTMPMWVKAYKSDKKGHEQLRMVGFWDTYEWMKINNYIFKMD